MPGGKVGFSNILATGYMAAIQDGKIITAKKGADTIYYYATQDDVDEFIATGKTFGDLHHDGVFAEGNLSRLRNDDNTEISESQQLNILSVNFSSDLWIFNEPEFVLNNV